ncbi:MAG: hypothetical protein QW350_04165 [Candidatus Aenigmatarchaeota archaeon]
MICINHVSSLVKNFTFKKGLSLLLIKDNPFFINYKDVYHIYPKVGGWSYLPKILSVLPKNPNLANLLIRLRKVCHTIHVSYKRENLKEIEGKRPISNKTIVVRFEYIESGIYHTIITAHFNKD